MIRRTLLVSLFTLPILSPSVVLADLVTAGDLFEAEGIALNSYAQGILDNLMDIESAIDDLGGNYQPTGGGGALSSPRSIGEDLFDAGEQLRTNNLFAAADLIEAEGIALDGFLGDIEENLEDIQSAIANLGGVYFATQPGFIGEFLFDAGEQLRANNLSAAANLIEAEGIALDGFAEDIEENLEDIQSAIANLGGVYFATQPGFIGEDLFDAAEQLRTVPEPSSFALIAAVVTLACLRRSS